MNTGKEIAQKFCDGLSQSHIPLVSGFAYGVDSIVHQMAIQNHEKTIAVLAGGFQHIYPKSNIKLIDPILENGGAIICENDVETEPYKYLFALRNRIIAALSRGTIVIEAAKTSGSLITAKNALELQKDLFVVPGGLFDEHYEGSNQLLVEGAKCVTNYQQIIEYYHPSQESEKVLSSQKEIPSEYQKIYHCLKAPKTSSQIAKALSYSMAEINAKLTMMEIEGYVKSMPRELLYKAIGSLLYFIYCMPYFFVVK